MAATAINGIRHSKSGAKAGLVVDGGFDGGFNAGWRVVRDMGWRERRLVQSAAKPNMRRETNPPVLVLGNGNNQIRPNYPIIAFGNCSR